MPRQVDADDPRGLKRGHTWASVDQTGEQAIAKTRVTYPEFFDALVTVSERLYGAAGDWRSAGGTPLKSKVPIRRNAGDTFHQVGRHFPRAKVFCWGRSRGWDH